MLYDCNRENKVSPLRHAQWYINSQYAEVQLYFGGNDILPNFVTACSKCTTYPWIRLARTRSLKTRTVDCEVVVGDVVNFKRVMVWGRSLVI